VTQDKETVHASSAEYLAITKFWSENSKAMRFLNTAARDYAHARCLLLNHLVSGGLAMGAQAIEKFLKAHILLKDPTRAVWGHDLTDLLKEADQLSPSFGLSRFATFTDRFERHYRTRYPGDPNASTSMTSEELFELDQFIMFLNDNLPLPFEAKHRSGLYALVTFSLHGRTVTPWEKWIKHLNHALAPRWPQIEADFRVALKKLHPNTAA